MQRARPIGALLVVAATFGVSLGLQLPPAAAQPSGTCPTPGVGEASVDVDSPRPGSQVQGVVVARGKVSAPRTVSRVELLIGRSLVDSRTFPATSSTEFSLTWDASRAAAGPATLKVVACGQGVGGLLVEGSTTVNVEVSATLPSTTGAEPAPSRTIGVPGRLLPAADEVSDPRPRRLWVGLVVGLFGLAGLVFAQVLHIRRPGQKEGA
ncbi:MAG TPA: Ig-like domain-containing protein [Acidimicrobiales bacterium]|nr:Ig-like domain-containing protein [Acidimicrobiales bacterium]